MTCSGKGEHEHSARLRHYALVHGAHLVLCSLKERCLCSRSGVQGETLAGESVDERHAECPATAALRRGPKRRPDRSLEANCFPVPLPWQAAYPSSWTTLSRCAWPLGRNADDVLSTAGATSKFGTAWAQDSVQSIGLPSSGQAGCCPSGFAWRDAPAAPSST